MLEKLQGNSFTVNSDWVKENDFNVYEYLIDMMRSFVADNGNETYPDDLQDFENGDWLVCYTFFNDKVDITAGRDSQALANQPTWTTDNIEDVDDATINLYLSQLQ